ncbi:UDP-glucuronosyltransferase 2B33-like [Photinus pyralis]|nr:UDP-glucuronosyltransferase 2B33-like [Photinus pyralis]
MDLYIEFGTGLFQGQEEIGQRHFQDNTPVKNLLQNVSLLFVNRDPIFHKIRPLLPSVIPIGGSLVRIPVKPLEKSIRRYLDGSHQGFIYFSLGSNVKSKDIPSSTLNTILETFRELPYRILWKVGMPFFVDQPFNVQQMVSLGFALSVDYKTMSKETFKQAILEVINNDKYRNRIRELANLVEDQPMTGLERAVWWTEYVIRHKGAAHLKSPALDMPWYQYYFLDVISVLLFTLIGALYFMVKVIKATLRALWRNVVRSKGKKN